MLNILFFVTTVALYFVVGRVICSGSIKNYRIRHVGIVLDFAITANPLRCSYSCPKHCLDTLPPHPSDATLARKCNYSCQRHCLNPF